MGLSVVLVCSPPVDVRCSGTRDGMGLEAPVAPPPDSSSAATNLDRRCYNPGAEEVLAGPDGGGGGSGAAVCLGGVFAEDLEGEAAQVSLIGVQQWLSLIKDEVLVASIVLRLHAWNQRCSQQVKRVLPRQGLCIVTRFHW